MPDDYARKYRNYSRFRSRSRSRSRRRRSWRRFLAPVLLVLAVIGVGLLYDWASSTPPASVAAASGPTDAGGDAVERTAALPPLNLPADDAAHGSTMEWWYYNGILGTTTGKRYAFHVAVFVANGLIKHTVMHAALTDLQTGQRHLGQTRTGGVPARGVSDGLDLRQGGWRVGVSGASHVVRASLEGASIALDMSDVHPPVLHRAAGSRTPGLLDFGKSGISYYYSRPRIAAQGEISIAGKPVQVSGDVWFDHQWGEFDVLTLGWNWFALHLADGSDLMLYQLFDAAGSKVMTAGTLSGARGSVALKPEDIELTPVGKWTSPGTKIEYPVDWRIRLPSGVLEVKPFFPDGEFDAGRTTANVYWEGPVKVTGSTTGEGFLELSGYERLNANRAGGKAMAAK